MANLPGGCRHDLRQEIEALDAELLEAVAAQRVEVAFAEELQEDVVCLENVQFVRVEEAQERREGRRRAEVANVYAACSGLLEGRGRESTLEEARARG